MPFVSIDHEGRVTGGGLADLSGFGKKLSKLSKKLAKNKVAVIASGGVAKALPKIASNKTAAAIATGGVTAAVGKATKGKSDKAVKAVAGKSDSKKTAPSPEPTEDPGEALPESEMVDPGMQKGGVFKTADGSPNYLLIGGLGLVAIAGLLLILKKRKA